MNLAKARKLLCILFVLVVAASLCLFVGCNGGSTGAGDNGGGSGDAGNNGGNNGNGGDNGDKGDSCTHNWSTEVIEPTCDENGTTTKTCTLCGDTRVQTEPKLGHQFEYVYYDGESYEAPSAGNIGYCQYFCLRDGCEVVDTYGEIDSMMVNDTLSKLVFEKVNGTYVVSGFNTVNYTPDSIAAVTEIVIPPEYKNLVVTGIADGAFLNCVYLQKISLPDTIETIGADAFSGCISLEEVTVGPASVLTEIKSNAFSGCELLQSFYIPDSEYTSFNSILPDTVEIIGDSAFDGCLALVLKNTEDSALTKIGRSAFARTAIKQFYLPSGITSFGAYAFNDCASLTRIYFPEENVGGGLSTIPTSAFSGCTSLTGLTIPAYVTSIGAYAFDGAESLRSLSFAPDCALVSIGTYAFRNNALTALTLPATLQTLSTGAFCYSKSLKTVTLPAVLTEIPAECFYYAKALEKIIWAEASDVLDDEGAVVGTQMTPVDSIADVKLTAIGEKAFYHAEKLESFILPDGVVSIGASAFSGTGSLQEFTISTNSALVSIGNEAFFRTGALNSILIPAGVTVIGDYAFQASGIKSLVFEDAASQTLSIGKFAFYGCSSIQNVALPAKTAMVGESAFGMCDGLKRVDFTDGETNLVISKTAFGNCASLVLVNLSENLYSLSVYAFVATESNEDFVLNFNGDWDSVILTDELALTETEEA